MEATSGGSWGNSSGSSIAPLLGDASAGKAFTIASYRDMQAKIELLESLARDLLAEISYCHMCGKESGDGERVRVFCAMCAEVMAHVRARALSGMGKELVNMLAGDDD